MTHGSLFSGIGGFDLAAEWMGWENIFHCEWNPFCQKVLKKHWPNVINYGDIVQTDFNVHRGEIDILTGGFPCQPWSVAGNRKGTEDERDLWHEMLRAIKEIQPNWIVGENVPGLINWGGGVVFHKIQTDLENAGYEVFPPLVLPACGVNASHRRDRLWIVAHSNSSEHNGTSRRYASKSESKRLQERHEMELINQSDCVRSLSDTNGIGWEGRKQRKQKAQEQGHDKKNCFTEELRYSGFQDVLPTPRIFGADDGLPNGVDRVKSLGNSIVPQVVFEIFKVIQKMEIGKEG